jgi:hypothetical protein
VWAAWYSSAVHTECAPLRGSCSVVHGCTCIAATAIACDAAGCNVLCALPFSDLSCGPAAIHEGIKRQRGQVTKEMKEEMDCAEKVRPAAATMPQQMRACSFLAAVDTECLTWSWGSVSNSLAVLSPLSCRVRLQQT